MPGAEFYTAAVETSQWVTAGAYLFGALVIAEIVDRALSRRGRKLTVAVGVGELSPVAVTRLRLVRRLVFATIIVIGIALAAAQIPSISKLATGILASSAVLGLVVGFAARQTLANGIAGILLAITQPIRIGDRVTFEDETGEVEDVKLTYTYIRLDDGRRLVVPNERLAQSSIANHTIIDPRLQVEVSVWLPPERRPRPRHRADRGRRGGHLGDRGGGGQGGRPAERHDVGAEPAASAARPPPSCADAGCGCSASTVYPQSRPPKSARPPSMSYRQRKSRRRNRHGVRSKMLLALGVIATVCVIGVLSLAGYVLAIASTAPNLSELKPVDKGQISVVYAADGSRLGYVQSDILRRVVPWAEIPVDLRRATVAIEDERFYKHKGVDVNAIVRAGVKNLESGETVQGGSTITQQLVRALYIKDPQAQLRAQDPRGQARLGAGGRALEDLDPRQLPQLGALRHGRGPHRDRRRGGRGHLLRQARQEPRPGRGGAARGPHPGALAVQPVPQSAGRARAAQRGAGEDARQRLHHLGRVRGRGQPAISTSSAAAATSSAASRTSSTTCRSS